MANTLLANFDRKKKNDPNAQPGINFENAVWRLFYKMGAEAFNNEKMLTFDFRQFLKSKNGPNCKSAQIDNLFIMRDRYVFIIECKETIQANGVNAANLIKQHLANWNDAKKFKRKRFEAIFGKNLRIIHVIATKGYKWKTDDIQKLTGDDYLLLREEEIKYFSGCYEHSKSAWFTFNQFLSTFRQGTNDFGGGKQLQTIGFRTATKLSSFNSAPKEIASKDKADAKTQDHAYTTSLKVIDLLKISSVSHYKADQIYDMGQVLKTAYQRILSKKRLRRNDGIPFHIETSDSPFINNLLINYKGDKPLDDCWQELDKGQGRGGILSFDILSPGMFHLIDGQHRLFGYCPLIEEDPNSKYGDHELVVTIFDNLNPRQEAQIFLDVNKKQEKVDANLTLEIQKMTGVIGNPEDQVHSLSQIIISHLATDSSSPFLHPKAIKDSTGTATDSYGDKVTDGKITNVGLHTYISKSRLISIHAHNFRTGNAYKIGSDDVDQFNNTADNLSSIYNQYFSRIKKANPDLWVKKDTLNRKMPNNKLMSSNIPIGGLILLLDRFVEFEVSNKQGKAILNLIDVHLIELEKVFKNISEQEKNILFNSSRYGGGGPAAFYYYLLDNYFPTLIDNKLKDLIDKDREKFNKKTTVKIIPVEILDEIKNLNTERNSSKTESERAQKTEEVVARWLAMFFQKVFGPDYWQDYIRPHHTAQYKKADDKDIDRQKKKQTQYHTKIYYLNWTDWQTILENTYSNAKTHNSYLESSFINSSIYKNDHNSDLRKLIENIFFIPNKKGQNGVKNNLSWFDVADNTRDEASHARPEPYLTQSEKDLWNKLEPEIDEVINKLRKLSSI